MLELRGLVPVPLREQPAADLAPVSRVRVQVEVALRPDFPVEELERGRAGDERGGGRLEGAEGAGAGVLLGMDVVVRARRGASGGRGGEETGEEAVDVECDAYVCLDGRVGGAAGRGQTHQGCSGEAVIDRMGDELNVEDALRKELQIQKWIKLARTAAMVETLPMSLSGSIYSTPFSKY